MSKGSNSSVTDTSTTSSVAPNPVAMKAYEDLLARVQNVSGTPYQAYGGEAIAPINEQQRAGFGGINAVGEGFQPYGAEAGANIAGGTAALTDEDIAQYYDPYTQQVIDATTADFDTQNARANSITTGNAAAQNALGGNRVGVAQALTQEAQTRAQAPVLANLRSAGYQRAVETANAQKERQLRGGQSELQGGLMASQAQVGAGTLEQTTKQAQDTQARADYFQAQGYPFATAQWLASIALPTGAQMGSTSTGIGNSATQGPQPNQWLQAAGLGVSAAATFSDRRLKENIEPIGKLHDGQTIYRYNFKGDPATQVGLLADEVQQRHPEAVGRSGGFGTVDYEAATDDAVQRFHGGRIAGFAGGGAPMMDVTGGFGWVPNAEVRGQALQAQPMAPPQHARLPEQKDQMAGIGKNLGTIGKGMWDKYNAVPEPLTDYSPAQDTSNPNYGVGPELSSFYDTGSSMVARGGGIVRRGFADGGVPVSSGFGGGFDRDEVIDLSDLPPINGAPTTAADRTADMNALRLSGRDAAPDPTVASNLGVIGDEPLTPRPVSTTAFRQAPQGDIVATAQQAFKNIARGVPPPRAMGFAQADDAPDDAPTDVSSRSRTPVVPRGVAAAPPSGGMGGFNPLNISDEARQGLISMGLGMMANRRGGPGSFLAGVGEGGEQGMTTYASARAATAARDAQARKEAFEREKFNRPYSEMTAAQKAQAARAGVPPGMRMVGDKMEFVPGGPHDPKTIRAEAEAKLPPNLMTPQSLDTAADAFRMTGRLPPNMGRGTQGAMQATMIQNRAAEREHEAGGDPSDWPNRWQAFGTRAAGMRTLENRAAGLTLAETEARALVPRVRELIAKVDRTRFPDLNSLMIAAKNKTGSVEEIKLGIAIGSLIPVYARVLKPVGQVGQTDMATAQHLLEQKWSAGQLNAALDQFEVELHTAKEALAQARKEYGESGPSINKKDPPPSASPPATPPAAPAPGSIKTITTKSEYDALPSGAHYLRDGNEYRKP